MNIELRSAQRSLAELVTDELRKAIYTGEFKEGDQLVQENLASKYGVSRMPIREALHQLEKERLIKINSTKRVYVLPIESKNLEELYTLRTILEVLALEKSFNEITEEDVVDLEELVIKMDKVKKNDKKGIELYIELNKEFHKLLIKHCNWNRLKSMVEDLWDSIAPLTPEILPDRIKPSNAEHVKIVNAIKDKNLQYTKDLLQTHIQNTNEQLSNFLSQKNLK